ncbi:ArsC family reductase [Methylotenera sp. 1P/1]|jgi:Spx/MgsR family transcriptional regulator|uniref:ArsC family reductase n=1 Tax=Methylotenera sp. 1P/1 TaxID=1131551 RepID=UPI00037C0DF9|nr:ArsC family reductase [Methylotenera sp. 1P/1]
MKLYGIPNCNTVKKARDWLDTHHIAYEFHDFKKQGISPQKLQAWLDQLPDSKLINRAGLTWRGLDDTTKQSIVDNASAIALMSAKTSVIKRPILEKDSKIIALGFSETEYSALFKQ